MGHFSHGENPHGVSPVSPRRTMIYRLMVGFPHLNVRLREGIHYAIFEHRFWSDASWIGASLGYSGSKVPESCSFSAFSWGISSVLCWVCK